MWKELNDIQALHCMGPHSTLYNPCGSQEFSKTFESEHLREVPGQFNSSELLQNPSVISRLIIMIEL
jgi:hypothetical protein